MSRATFFKALRGALALGILGWVAWRLAHDWSALSQQRLELEPGAVLLASGAGAGAILWNALVFTGLLRAVGFAKPGHLAFHLKIWFISYFHRYVPGKVMLVVERVRLGELVGIPRTTGVVLVVWETLLLLAGASLVGGLGLAAAGSSIAGAPPLAAVVAVGVVALVALSLAPRVLKVLLPRVPFLRDRVPHLAVEASPLAVVGLSLGYAGVWALLGLTFVLTCRLFPEGQQAGLEDALWYVLAYVGGMVLGLTPAGLGVREGLLVAGLATRYPPATALAFALASRVLLSVVELPLVGLAALVPTPSTPREP